MNGIDTISLIAWGTGAAVGLVGGLMRMWLPFLFLMAAMGFAGGLAYPIGSSLFAFVDSESARMVGAFFLVFVPIIVVGGFITLSLLGALSAMSLAMVAIPFGGTFNRFGGVLLGALSGCILLSVFLIGLYQFPVESVAGAVDDSSFAGNAMSLVDKYVAALEFSKE